MVHPTADLRRRFSRISHTSIWMELMVKRWDITIIEYVYGKPDVHSLSPEIQRLLEVCETELVLFGV